MNEKDYNGYTPDDDTPDDYKREYNAGYSAGYNQAVLDLMFAMIGKMRDDLTATLERIAA